LTSSGTTGVPLFVLIGYLLYNRSLFSETNIN